MYGYTHLTTKFKILRGTKMIFTTVLPSRNLATEGCSLAAATAVSFSTSFGTSKVARNLPLTCLQTYMLSQIESQLRPNIQCPNCRSRSPDPVQPQVTRKLVIAIAAGLRKMRSHLYIPLQPCLGSGFKQKSQCTNVQSHMLQWTCIKRHQSMQ